MNEAPPQRLKPFQLDCLHRALEALRPQKLLPQTLCPKLALQRPPAATTIIQPCPIQLPGVSSWSRDLQPALHFR